MLERITLPAENSIDLLKAKEDAERHSVAMAGMYRYARDIVAQLPEPEQSELRGQMDRGEDLLPLMTRLCSEFVLPVPSYLKRRRAA